MDGKYIWVYSPKPAKLTDYDKKGAKCILDWQRHNGEWMTLYEGNLEECLKFIEEDEWFEGNIGLNTSQ